MGEGLFEKRMASFQSEGELTGFNLACVAEALDTIQELNDQNVGGETVEQRIGEYKSWDPEIFKVDKDCEDGFRARLEERGTPVILLSEEVGRLPIPEDTTDGDMYVVADPFDGSYLFKRGIPDFWYSSLAFFGKDFSPLSCGVGDGVHKNIAFANENGAFIATVDGEGLKDKFQLNKAYRDVMGRQDVTDLEKASIESYAMKPKKFCLALVDEYRELMEPFKFFLPNGGPYGFVDVAEGKIDCYFARQQPFVDVFSGIYVAEQAEVVVTDFDGNLVKCSDNVKGLYDVVCTTNQNLHDQVLELIAKCKSG